MLKTFFRCAGFLILIGGSLYAISPRFWIGDNADDARRDAERRRRQQEDIRRDEERRRIRQEEEAKQQRRLNPDSLLSCSLRVNF